MTNAGRRLALAVLLVALLALSACAQGFIFRRTVEPLSTDFARTPVHGCAPARSDVKQVRYRYLDFRWDGNGIGQVARQAGFDKAYYADFEVLSILGIWTQSWVIVYGDREGQCAEARDR
ncbi:MAG: hypothetical protein GY725_08535 [bacterium]|nr:hypothetical protein [bacterium]